MTFKSVVRKLSWTIRNLPVTVWFNFTKLPFSQARKLPILLYKPKFINNSGRIEIDGPVKFGMIKLGSNCVSIYPNNGLRFENNGLITFKGSAVIGNNSAISIGPTGHVTFGDGFKATSTLKLICYNEIVFDKNVLVGWDCMFCDTDFHKLTFVNNNGYSKGYGTINVGHDCWFANGCKTYKNIYVPNCCVIGADTVLYKPFKCEPYSLDCNDTPIVVKASGVYHNMNDDEIQYKSNYKVD